jgi:hypothetical protein
MLIHLVQYSKSRAQNMARVWHQRWHTNLNDFTGQSYVKYRAAAQQEENLLKFGVVVHHQQILHFAYVRIKYYYLLNRFNQLQ